MEATIATPLSMDPDEKRLFAINWTRALPSGVTVTGATWKVETGTATLGTTSSDPSPGATKVGGINGNYVTVWVMTAAVGTFTMSCRATLSNGEIRERTVTVNVAQS